MGMNYEKIKTFLLDKTPISNWALGLLVLSVLIQIFGLVF